MQAQALAQTYRERYPELAASLPEGAKLGRPGKLIPQQQQEVIRTVCGGPRHSRCCPIVRHASLKHYSLTGRSDEGSRREDCLLRQEFQGIGCRLGLLCVNGFPSDGSSFLGLLTRGEISHSRIWSAG